MENFWKDQNARLAMVFIIGLIIGYGGHWMFTRQGTATIDKPIITVDEDSVDALGSLGVIVKNQVAGDTVAVERVAFEQPGWVAIHDDLNGVPGRILGAQLFDKGVATGTVTLLRNTEEGKSYFAVLHGDDGTYKNFNPKTDVILKDEAGEPIMVGFTAGTIDNGITFIPVDDTLSDNNSKE